MLTELLCMEYCRLYVVYHVLQPSPAGNLWPTLYTLLPLRQTGRTVSTYMPTAIGTTLLIRYALLTALIQCSAKQSCIQWYLNMSIRMGTLSICEAAL